MTKGELYGDKYKVELGIGVNLNTPKDFYLQANLLEASSVFAESGKGVDVKDFFWTLTQKLIQNFETLKGFGFQSLLEYMRAKMKLVGKEVTVYNKVVFD
eukprot:CAMPEP_0170562668 /NCGR_PEP_ID=MMETSP0211-20121228/61817_1 /TAXON_ID=311385 /ORGANISM="Pseudokeronopsis sp., Strain OXSARD2" /LENGTH=99 /DNA_ID=CAMNT_0010879839 /DNA_START=504 /DNA_END=803 /DNA_ORIENTATION=+